jgi:hypothetical protein
MAIDYEKLLAAIDEYKENSYGWDETSALGQKRAKAIEYYLGLNTNPAPQGRSQVVDRSVYETIQVMLPSLVKIFAGSSEEVCKAVPIGPDDEQGAEQTTAVLRHYVTEKNQWEQIVSDWIHDALLLGNGYCMAYWDESERLVREVYEGQSDDQVASLMQDKTIKVVQHSQTVDKQATSEAMAAYQQQMQQYQQMSQQMMMQAQQTGQPPQIQPPPQRPQPVLLHDLVIDRAENDGKVCIKVIPPEHCYISTDTPDWTLNECPYFEFRQQKTIADLRDMGLDVSEDVNDDDSIESSVEDSARDRFGENDFNESGKGVMREVWTRSIWVRTDAGDEESRLYYVIAVGKTILYAEPCASIPVASMTSEPLPHRHIGMSLAESVMDIQDVKQAVKRGALDNLYLANNGRHIISSKVNVEDFLDARPGGVIRMMDESLPGEGHVVPLVHPFSFDTIIGSLEYFDQDRQNRTGASRYFSGTDAGAINKTASGTIALQNMASMRVEHRARMMAPGIENLFRAVWEIVSKHANKSLALKLNGKWVLVDPQAWRTRRDIRISVGVGAGNKESMMGNLQQIFGAQMNLMPTGVAGPAQIYATMIEMAKLSGFANPEKFWIDPRQYPPPPPPPNPDLIKIQADQQAKQVELQAEAQKFQAETQLEQQKMAFEANEKEKDRQLELEKTRMSEATKLAIAEMNRETTLETTDKSQTFEVQKMGATFQREDMLKQQEQNKIEEKDDGMQELMTNLQIALQNLAGAINRPRVAVRDPKTNRPLYGRPMTDEEMAKINPTIQ